MDPDVKKKVLRKIGYGLYVATATAGQETEAASVSWLSQVSFDPPLLVVAIRNESHMRAVVEQAGSLVINFVSADQKEIASTFFRPTRVEGNRLDGHAFEPGAETRAPVLLEAPAWVEARVRQTVTPGDHVLFVVEVVGAGLRDEGFAPLILPNTEWTYAG